MRRIAAIAAVALGLSLGFAYAQQERPEEAEKAGHNSSEAEEGSLKVWEWLNFAILAAGLVWLFRKNAVPYFASRAIGIRKEMIEADDVRAEAERKLADVDARLARLRTDVEALKGEALEEAKAEQARARQETEAALAKIRRQAEQEITAAGKAARLELKRYSAQLAIGLAEQKIRARMNPDTQAALFRGFLHEMDGRSRPQNN